MKILKHVLLLCFVLPCASAECSEVLLVEGRTWSPRLPIQSDAELSYVRLNPGRRNHRIRFLVREDGSRLYSVILDEKGHQTKVHIGFRCGTWSSYQKTVRFRLERPETRLRLAYYNSNRRVNVALYDKGSRRWATFHREGGPALGTGSLSIAAYSGVDGNKFLIKLPCPQVTELAKSKKELREANIKFANSNAALERTRKELREANAKFTNSNAALDRTKKKLSEANTKFAYSNAALARTRKELREANAKFTNSNAALERTKKELSEANANFTHLGQAQKELDEAQRSSNTFLATTIVSTVLAVILGGTVVFVCCSSRWRRPGQGEETPGGGMAMQNTTTQEQGLEGGEGQGTRPPMNHLNRSTSHETVDNLYVTLYPR